MKIRNRKLFKELLTRSLDVVTVLAAAYTFFRVITKQVEGQALLEPLVAMVAILLIGEIVRAIVYSTEEDKISKLLEIVLNLQETGKHAHVIQILPSPQEVKEYVQFWGDFTGEYFAYNPAYRLESRKRMTHEAAIQLFVPRYRDPDFKLARYLFLTADEAGKEDFDIFKNLMNLVARDCPEIKKKLQIKRLSSKPAASVPEVYFGIQRDTNVAIVEPLGIGFSSGTRGCPEFYLRIHSDGLIKSLERDFFSEWEKAGDLIDIFN